MLCVNVKGEATVIVLRLKNVLVLVALPPTVSVPAFLNLPVPLPVDCIVPPLRLKNVLVVQTLVNVPPSAIEIIAPESVWVVGP